MIWNLEKKLLISNIKLNGNVSAHSLAYMHDFKSLAIATFGNEIALYNIYNDDVSLMGHLVGHITTVTALGMLNDSPLFISCDEVGVIKTWDVRFQTCIQTVFTNPSIQIRKFINLDSDKFVGMERRLVWFRYEDKLTVNSNGIKIHRNYPIGIEFNKELNEIYLCTKTDIRCLDMITGKVKRVISIFNSDYENTGVEIDHFGLSVDRRHFIICLSNGKMSLHLVRDGKFMRKLFKHKNVIANTTVDRKNKYIVSAGWDGQIIIQKDNTEKKSLHRRLKKANLGKPINILKLCHETNALATVSHSEVFVWTYSSMTLLGSFECDSREVLAVEFILDIPFIATLDETSCIKVWSFKTEDRSTFLDPILCIKTGVDLGDQLYIHKIERCRLLEQEPDDPPTKFWFSDIKARNGRSMTVLSAQEYNSHDWLRRFNQDHKI